MSSHLPYKTEYATTNRASCRRCCMKIDKEVLRIAAMVPSAFSDNMTPHWYHMKCFFHTYSPSSIYEIAGFNKLKTIDQQRICSLVGGEEETNTIPDQIVNRKSKSLEEQELSESEIPCKKMKKEPRETRQGTSSSLKDEVGIMEVDSAGISEGKATKAEIKLEEVESATNGDLHDKERIMHSENGEITETYGLTDKEIMKNQNDLFYKYRDGLEGLAKLNQILEKNGQKITNYILRKDHLADCMAFGALEPCPKCDGQLVLDTFHYKCTGVGAWCACTYTARLPSRRPLLVPDNFMDKAPFIHYSPKVDARLFPKPQPLKDLQFFIYKDEINENETVGTLNNDDTGVSQNNEDTDVSLTNDDTGFSQNNEYTGVSLTNDGTDFSQNSDDTGVSLTNDGTGFSQNNDDTGVSLTNDGTGFSQNNDDTGVSLTNDGTDFSQNSDDTGVSLTNDGTGFSQNNDDTGVSLTNDGTDFSQNNEYTGVSLTNDGTGFSQNNDDTGVSLTNDDTGVSQNNEDTGVSQNNEDTGFSLTNNDTGFSQNNEETGVSLSNDDSRVPQHNNDTHDSNNDESNVSVNNDNTNVSINNDHTNVSVDNGETHAALEVAARVVQLGGKVCSELNPGLAAVVWLRDKERLQASSATLKQIAQLDIQVVHKSFFDLIEKSGTMDHTLRLINEENIADWGSDPATRLGIENTATTLMQPNEGEGGNSGFVKYKAKGGVVLDPVCPLRGVHVACAPRGAPYSAVLSRADVASGQNSYYRMQLLRADTHKQYWVFFAWGRIGTDRADKQLLEFKTRKEAKAKFFEKFKEKTNNRWKNRANFVKHPKYYYLQDLEYVTRAAPDMETSENRALPSSVQLLVKKIFDIEEMQRTLVEFKIDTAIMPLGKITRKQLSEAYSVLSSLAELIASAAPDAQAIDVACSRLYSLVPHNFGPRAPPALSTLDAVERKRDMLDQLMAIELTYTMRNTGGTSVEECYHKLRSSIRPLPRPSPEHQLLHDYLTNTHAATHPFSLQIHKAFKVIRLGERSRYEKYSGLHNRRLLWHGSRLTNYAGILSQGLRIAPPEAPMTGYMFGKGIYFADVATKSAQYCGADTDHPHGLLLLAEVALGDMKECLDAEYVTRLPPHKHSVWGVGRNQPDPGCARELEDGSLVPLGALVPSGRLGGLLYNEFIVYNEAQVNVKYLLDVKFDFNLKI